MIFVHKEIEEKLQPLKKMKERLVEWCESEVSRGKETVDAKELGEAVDMIKDLAEAESLCWQACYYKHVSEAMEEQSDMTMGYNPNRSARTGRYTMGYTDQMMEQMPYVDRYLQGMRMGYGESGSSMYGYSGGSGSSMGSNSSGSGQGSNGSSGSGSGSSSSSSSSGYSPSSGMWVDSMTEDPMEYRNGKAYKDWKMARRHYTQTGDKADKDEMSAATTEHVLSMMATIREMWKTADTDQKKRIKQDLQNLVGELTV